MHPWYKVDPFQDLQSEWTHAEIGHYVWQPELSQNEVQWLSVRH